MLYSGVSDFDPQIMDHVNLKGWLCLLPSLRHGHDQEFNRFSFSQMGRFCLNSRDGERRSTVHLTFSNASSSLEIQGLISLLWRAMFQIRTRPACRHAVAPFFGTQDGPSSLRMPYAPLPTPPPSTGQQMLRKQKCTRRCLHRTV